MTKNVFELAESTLEMISHWAVNRIRSGPDPAAGARPASELELELAGSICASGIGAEAAMRRFTDVVVPATRAQDDPMNLAYVAAAPTPAAVTFDLAVSAAEIFGGTWETGAGAVHCENQALLWLAGLAGWPATAGGTFVAGGTLGNLSALHAARTNEAKKRERPTRWKVASSDQAHSSIVGAAAVLDVDIVEVPTGEHGRMDGVALAETLADEDGVFAVVATAGTTNAGVIDDLVSIADVCEKNDIWLHVDGAYGLAALASPTARKRFSGIERADSFIVDPHKWLFAPYDCCALVYRNPVFAVAAHSQVAPYLDQIDREAWNPSEYAIHLSRRVRGMPLWFSLATYGTDRYAIAIDRVLATAQEIARGIKAADHLELVLEPDLSVVLFRRPGFSEDDMKAWSERHRVAGTMLCLPTRHQGEMIYRLCLVNPWTESSEVLAVLETLR